MCDEQQRHTGGTLPGMRLVLRAVDTIKQYQVLELIFSLVHTL
jgi:hypothetical protein